MNAKEFSNALGEVNDKYVSEAIQYKAKKKKPVLLKWVAMAACLCIVLIGAFSVMTLQQGNEPQVGMEKYMSELGLDATIVHDPVLFSAIEMPKITKDNLLESIKKNLTVQGEITSLESAVIEDNDSTWYITTMTISVKEVISGNSQNDEISIVNGAVYTDYTGVADDGAIPVRGLAGCHVGMESVFVLNALDDSPWDIAGKEVFPLELGEYYVVYRLDRENDTLTFTEQNISVNLDELKDSYIS